MARALAAAAPLEGDEIASGRTCGSSERSGVVQRARTPQSAILEERDAFAGKLARRIGGRWRSEGRRLLWVRKGTGIEATDAEAMPTTTNRKLAAQLGVTERYVSMLLSGQRQPSADTIARAWLTLGIPGESWGLAPQKGTPRSWPSAVADASSEA